MHLRAHITTVFFFVFSFWSVQTHGRAIESSDILISIEQMNGMIRARSDKPKDEYTPHDPPVHWTALGDSYTAGIGAGDPFDPDNPSPCYRTTGSYAVQLNDDYPWDVEYEYDFLACTGHKINDIWDEQLPKVSDDIDERQDFMMMTIGGNDAEFSSLVRICALGIEVPVVGRDCQAQIDASMKIIDSPEFYADLWNLYDQMFAKLDHNKAEEYYQLYHLQYPIPFDINNGDDWCDDKDIYHDCMYCWNMKHAGYKWSPEMFRMLTNGSDTSLHTLFWICFADFVNLIPGSFPPPTNGPKLTNWHRYYINSIVRRLNETILRIAIAYVKDKQSNEWRGHLPGWARNRLFIVNPNFGWIGHRFCEKGVRNFDDPSIYFIPYCDRAQGESDDQFTTLDHFQLDADSCNSTDQYKNDEAYGYECEISRLKKYGPDKLNPGAKFLLPENWAKIFHPRPNGHKMYKSTQAAALLNRRPRMNRKGSTDPCKPMDFELPTNESITYQPPGPNDEKFCPPDDSQASPTPSPSSSPPSPPTPPAGPSKALGIVADSITPSSLQDYDNYYLDWIFFATDYGKSVDCRTDAAYNFSQKVDITKPDTTYYPGGEYSLNLFGEDCQYKNSGDNPGKLFCGDKVIDCVDDPADKNPSDPKADKGRYQCGDTTREPVFTCAY